MNTSIISSFIIFLFLSFSVQAQYYFPKQNADWTQKQASEIGWDQNNIDKAIQFVNDNEYSGSKDLRQAILKGFEYEPFHKILGPTKKRGGPAGMILHKGYLIASWGDIEKVDMTFSVTKSYLSTVAGLALQNNLIKDINDPVGQHIWDGYFGGSHNSKITWYHLLTQSSDWSGQLWGGYDWADRPPKEGGIDDWKMREFNEPGSVFEYNDVRVNLLAYSLLQVWRKPLPMVIKEKILDPIGASTTWRWYGYDNSWVNVDGVQMQSVSGGGHSGGGMFISTKDQARFGLLFLNNGEWEGTQLLDSSWIKKATQPSLANSNYGYMWWLNKPGDRHMEKFSEKIFYAAGFGGNYIVIDQEKDLVIVTRWLEPNKLEAFLEILYGL